MASLGGNMLPPQMDSKIVYAGIAGVVCFAIGLSRVFADKSENDQDETPGLVKSLLLFAYSCFLKPHEGDSKGNQQDALESFYKKQAGIYDSTRSALLRGREDMLALVAAQLEFKAKKSATSKGKKEAVVKRVWVDVGGGTGFNIEAMNQFVNVPEFFSSVYLVDFSPSLCEVARKRFARLGWKNVQVICEDARKFKLEDYENDLRGLQSPPVRSPSHYFSDKRPEHGGADLITMSYSLSMIPDYYSVIDSLTCLLSPDGVMGVVDFYVQSKVDVNFRNYTGGLVNRHVNFLGRTFWRAWFDIDRVGLEPSRRDYLEYRFGTLLGANFRNNMLGAIPYYVWLGCHKKPFASSSLPQEIVEYVDALVTESPYLLPANAPNALTRAVQRTAPEIRSKAFDAAVGNLASNLPLPAFFYQNHHWRIYYDERLKKHTQFNDEYIYAFTWEDSRTDARILNLKSDDVVLAICSAGDNILSYVMQGPARVHAVDLNPTQCHLLELKVAAYNALPYEDFWKIFGEGKHTEFRQLLVSKLSPHLSSRAFQYWLSNAHIFTSARGRGLYDTGGSKHAIRVMRWIARVFGLQRAVAALLEAKTLNEQREVWRSSIRPALLSTAVNRLVVSQEAFLWAALGVPKNQLAMIEADHAARGGDRGRTTRSQAVWNYMVDTLDPVAEGTHIAADNPYYHVCLAGRFSRRCHPEYLAPQAHARLSRPGALDGLRIHTDELDEVIARIMPGTLTVAVVMDSMDWFDPQGPGAAAQVRKLNRALKMGGRVMLRSAALTPWYVKVFEQSGFSAKRHGERLPGVCIDRVNMYASCWVLSKTSHLPPPTPDLDGAVGAEMDSLVI
ncbi:S-adenosyl-L-methionine-dependent methyltransferase [Cryphonectria parasitica EP155]|uniref:S-adenosyl-L-methionine-dependent methyltransferase n=1 Tax=Cryphonectria parasitica (strain ATCC 38755 / EP155) TaxID=660469 RepID=A0A9P5CP84_CRYP1|nr:S-adenosyl-L-methionine-dependent methyltransferase [Cryphonectria parasitica EP155]KAF3764720.1 S-adenosyl-L-methionine-dependent methyltransferase [Cryphonectria parasitica EP155]